MCRQVRRVKRSPGRPPGGVPSHVLLGASMVRLQHRAALVLLCLLANAVAYLHPPPEDAERWNARVYQGMVSPRGRTAREPGRGGGGAANETRRRLRPITLKQVGHPRPLVLLACSGVPPPACHVVIIIMLSGRDITIWGVPGWPASADQGART